LPLVFPTTDAVSGAGRFGAFRGAFMVRLVSFPVLLQRQPDGYIVSQGVCG
jgi:hypothetical protein